MASRYASFDSRSRTSSTGNPIPPPSKALVSTASSRALSRPQQSSNIGAMVRKLINKPVKPKFMTGSGDRKCPTMPFDVIAEDAKKVRGRGSTNFSSLHRKLFQKGGSGVSTTNRALTEVKSNTRTLSMVLRSERDLLDQNKVYEGQLLDLQLALEEKNREVEKLKDLCLKQRDEIKALKDAILFPDVVNSQLQELLEKQNSELKQAKGVIPTLQKQVTSLTGQLSCLAEDLAEVKAEKSKGRSCNDERRLLKSPRLPIYNKHEVGLLDLNSMRLMDSGSPPDDMLLRDMNPCLTPYFSKTKSKEYDLMLSDDFLSEDDDGSFGKSSQSTCHIYDDKVCGSSSEYFRQHCSLRRTNPSCNSYGIKSSSSGKVQMKPK